MSKALSGLPGEMCMMGIILNHGTTQEQHEQLENIPWHQERGITLNAVMCQSASTSFEFLSHVVTGMSRLQHSEAGYVHTGLLGFSPQVACNEGCYGNVLDSAWLWIPTMMLFFTILSWRDPEPRCSVGLDMLCSPVMPIVLLKLNCYYQIMLKHFWYADKISHFLLYWQKQKYNLLEMIDRCWWLKEFCKSENTHSAAKDACSKMSWKLWPKSVLRLEIFPPW